VTAGLALPVLPLHVHQGLGLSTFVVGLVTGSQFAASLVSRVWSGRYADSRGAKRAVVTGLLTAVASGLLYLSSLGFVSSPIISVTILLLGRALLGGAESFIITGAVAWGLALAGPKNAGRVIAWVGMAMFAALAVGAPVGTTLYAGGGLGAVAVATTLVPLITILIVFPLAAIPPQHGTQPGIRKMARAVWMPGFGSALSSIGFGAMIGFSSLFSAERGWSLCRPRETPDGSMRTDEIGDWRDVLQELRAHSPFRDPSGVSPASVFSPPYSWRQR
jgi:MFS family permease